MAGVGGALRLGPGAVLEVAMPIGCTTGATRTGAIGVQAGYRLAL